VQAAFVLRSFRPVTTVAIYELQVLASGMPALGRVQVTVAIDAHHVAVNGCSVNLLGHEGRNFLFATGAREFLVGVTVETLLVVLRECWDGG